MNLPPEGERPDGREPVEGLPPEDQEAQPPIEDDLPELEPEFVEALRQAADDERVEPEQHTPQETAELPSLADGDGSDSPPTEAEPDDKPRRTVVIESGPEAPTEVSPKPAVSATPPAPQPGSASAPADSAPPDAPPAMPAAPPPSPVSAPPEHAPVPPTARTPGLPRKPPPEGDWEPAPRRGRLWLRFLIASVLIIGSMASATYASVLKYFGDIAGQLGDLPGVRRQLLPPKTGQPENILILGSDKRASEPGTRGLSDTTILLRLDPDNNAIALMSIPRDLKTYIPGVGTTKFNAAYAYGGPKLTLRVVKSLTGLQINHVVNVDFLGFVRAVNAIGCVYVDVDRRYYHSNVGLPASLQYAEINIQPGYQKLCGTNALAYARYRHTDTDLVRAARQQDFLREARQQVPASDLFFSKRDELLNIFTSYTTSDISKGETLLDVLKLFVASRNAPIKEIHFPGVLHPSYVTASKSSIKRAVNHFLGIHASGGPRGSLELPRSSGHTGIVPQERKRARAAKRGQGGKAPATPTPANDGLVDASQGSRDVAAQAAAQTVRSFPVFYPRRLPGSAIFVQQPRVYHLRDTGGNRRGAYVMVLQLPQGDYFGVQGVHGWTDPPILSSPSETRTMNGRQYEIFLDGDRVRMVAWHKGDNSYWVYNSLLQTLTNNQMLGMARSVGELPGRKTIRPARKHHKR